MSVSKYQMFVKTVECGSFSKAAEALNFTQSGVSHAVQSLEDELGVMTVARPPEVREYGFLPAGVYDKDHFALRLMDKPASYFYSVLWNKLYRRDILVDNHLQFTSEVRWAEDLVFNLEYILYANVFVSIPKAGYHYVQNPQSICHTQINLSTIMQNRLQMIDYYKDLYTKLGLYEEVQTQLHASLLGLAESVSPTLSIQKALSDAAEYWYAFFAGSDEEAELAAERSGRKAAAKKKQKLGTE